MSSGGRRGRGRWSSPSPRPPRRLHQRGDLLGHLVRRAEHLGPQVAPPAPARGRRTGMRPPPRVRAAAPPGRGACARPPARATWRAAGRARDRPRRSRRARGWRRARGAPAWGGTPRGRGPWPPRRRAGSCGGRTRSPSRAPRPPGRRSRSSRASRSAAGGRPPAPPAPRGRGALRAGRAAQGDQLHQLGREVLRARRLRERRRACREAVGAGRASDAEVDPAGVEGLQHLEGLRDLERASGWAA